MQSNEVQTSQSGADRDSDSKEDKDRDLEVRLVLLDAFDITKHKRPVESPLTDVQKDALQVYRTHFSLKPFFSAPHPSLIEHPKKQHDHSSPGDEGSHQTHGQEKPQSKPEYELVKELRQRLDECKILEEVTSEETKEYASRDFNLLRFLRARGHDVTKAHKLLLGALRWREEHKPWSFRCTSCVSALEKCERDPQTYQLSKESCSDFRLIGYDPKRRPVMYCSFRRTKHRGVHETIAHTGAALEKAVSSMNEGSPGDVIVINNFNGFGFSDLNPMVGVRAIQIFSDYYPETLKMMIVVDPPRIFWPLFHKVLKPLLAKETAAKALFLDSTVPDGGRAVLREHFTEEMSEWIATRIKMDY